MEVNQAEAQREGQETRNNYIIRIPKIRGEMKQK